MPIAVTREDLIKVGERIATESLVAEIDRVLPIATADASLLAAGGYSAALLDELRAHRTMLTSESAERRAQRGEKKGARQVEASAVVDGKRVLRAGIAMAEVAIQHRAPTAGETEEQTRAIVTELVSRLEGARGVVGRDSSRLRTRLAAIGALLGSAEIAPDASGRTARDAMIAKVHAAAAALPALAEQKRSAQQAARTNTSDLDEIDGRAYLNLKSLLKVGRAQWIAAGDRKRASEYQLVVLRDVPAPRREEPAPT